MYAAQPNQTCETQPSQQQQQMIQQQQPQTFDAFNFVSFPFGYYSNSNTLNSPSFYAMQ